MVCRTSAKELLMSKVLTLGSSYTAEVILFLSLLSPLQVLAFPGEIAVR
jgi:hypothetical protein